MILTLVSTMSALIRIISLTAPCTYSCMYSFVAGNNIVGNLVYV